MHVQYLGRGKILFLFSSLVSFIVEECKLKSLWFETRGHGALAMALRGTWDRISEYKRRWTEEILHSATILGQKVVKWSWGSDKATVFIGMYSLITYIHLHA
jgi:hypothetical protein